MPKSLPVQTTFLFVGANCYGGLAQTRFMRSLLALDAACVARRLRLRTELGGGEALVSRARAGVLAQFLAGEATHLLIVDSDVAFTPEAIFKLTASGKDVAGAAGADGALVPGLMLITRKAAQAVADAHPELRASLRDVRGAQTAEAPMVFDSLIAPGTGRYLADLDAFARRWRDLGGEVWADPDLGPWR